MGTRLTGSGTSAYTYTSENRLATGPGGAALAYDSTGRLSQVYTPALSTNFDYDGAALIGERDAVSYGLLRRYVHGPGEDQPLVWYEGAGVTDKRYLMTDERGSVVAVTNNTGAASGINSYDEYGIPASSNVGRFGYTGQTWIPEIGLNYYKARMYSPTLGRFMQTDPIGYKDGVNWYAYVRGDPVNRSDPTGLFGLFGGCPAGSSCTSTNPGASNLLAADKRETAKRSTRGRKHEKVVDGLNLDAWTTYAAKSMGRSAEQTTDKYGQEVVYAIFINDKTKKHLIDTEFGYTGKDGLPKSSIVLDRKGYTLLLTGHTHSWPISEAGGFFGGRLAAEGPSPIDLERRRSHPDVPHLVQQKAFGTGWETVKY